MSKKGVFGEQKGGFWYEKRGFLVCKKGDFGMQKGGFWYRLCRDKGRVVLAQSYRSLNTGGRNGPNSTFVSE